MRHPGCTTSEGFDEDNELEPSQIAVVAVGVKYQDGHGWAGLPPKFAKLRQDGPEPPRVSRRLQLLRGLEHEQIKSIFPRG